MKVVRLLLVVVVFVISLMANDAYALEDTRKALPCETCSLNTASGTAVQWQSQTVDNILKVILVCFIIAISAFYLWKSYKKVVYPVIGSILVVLVLASGFVKVNATGKEPDICALEKSQAAKSSVTGFQKPGDEFAGSTAAATDEFAPMNSSDTTASNSEFTPTASEFSEQKPVGAVTGLVVLPDWSLFYQVIVLLALGVVVSLFLKYKWMQSFRGLTLLLSLLYLGFYKGGCPCMIMSFQNTLLFVLGNPVSWMAMFWFLGLIPLTYFFGKVWCGWLCHLGALQEFIFRSKTKKAIASPRVQKTLKITQIILFAALVIQVIITRSNLYVQIDPFKVAFNLISANVTGYVLLAILLLSSLFVYRPFCRAVCPVGLILGWISLIPGAHNVKADKDSCNSCKRCTTTCKQEAMTLSDKGIRVNSEECIACGECLHVCKRNALNV